MDYAFFQEYWWLLVSVLGALLVFLLFVQGGQSLFFSIGKEQLDRKLLVNSIGRKWDEYPRGDREAMPCEVSIA